jgi:hypothetical protein
MAGTSCGQSRNFSATTEGRLQNVEIEVARESRPPDWDELVREDPEATFFHTAAWISLLVETIPGFQPSCFVARDDGRAVAGIPALVRKRLGLTVLESMPFGTFGGLVRRNDAPEGVAEALLDAFARAARRPLTASAHLVDLPRRVTGKLRGFEAVREEAQVVRLDREYDELERAFKPTARNKIRKARKAGVTVRRASGKTDFLGYHDMLVECEGRWGVTSLFGQDFFRGLSQIDGDVVEMWLAEHEGSIVGGDLNFTMNGMIFNWGNVSREKARDLAPNNLLHATAIEEGVKAGRDLYNLGSSAGIAGVEAFKESFGTERVDFHHYRAEKAWSRALRSLASGHREDRS